MLYGPTTAYLFEWWLARRGFASGVLFSGTGLGGLVMPIVSSALLQWGQRTALLGIAVAYAILLGALIPFIRPRLPVTAMKRHVEWDFTRARSFWFLCLGVALQGLAAFMPGTYLPAYAAAFHLPRSVGTLSLALMNLARVPGQILIGYASDSISARRLIVAMCFASSITVFAGWGAAVNVGGVLAFAVVFGCFAGSYTALFPRFISVIDTQQAPMLYSLFSFARGVGSIASGPLSAAMLERPVGGSAGYASGYGAVIVYTGVAMVASGVGAC